MQDYIQWTVGIFLNFSNATTLNKSKDTNCMLILSQSKRKLSEHVLLIYLNSTGVGFKQQSGRYWKMTGCSWWNSEQCEYTTWCVMIQASSTLHECIRSCARVQLAVGLTNLFSARVQQRVAQKICSDLTCN